MGTRILNELSSPKWSYRGNDDNMSFNNRHQYLGTTLKPDFILRTFISQPKCHQIQNPINSMQPFSEFWNLVNVCLSLFVCMTMKSGIS